jgi:hypothetical protein
MSTLEVSATVLGRLAATRPVDHWHIDATFTSEECFQTSARAGLTAGPEHLDGEGSARTNPVDRTVPDVGREVATAWALIEPARRVPELAAARISVRRQQGALIR